MAQFHIPTNAADPVRTYLEGVAKHLVDQLYGKDGPQWGTQLSELEETIEAIGHTLSENLLEQALQRQADTAEQRPGPYQHCPKCGGPVQPRESPQDTPPKSRAVQTSVGQAQWVEPETYCRSCRRAFFPSDHESGD